MTGWERLVELLARHPGTSLRVATPGSFLSSARPVMLALRLHNPNGPDEDVVTEEVRDLHPLELDRVAGELAFKTARHLSDLEASPTTTIPPPPCKHLGALVLHCQERPYDEWRWQCTRCREWFFMPRIVAMLAEAAHA